jgi:hypothetical protein
MFLVAPEADTPEVRIAAKVGDGVDRSRWDAPALAFDKDLTTQAGFAPDQV